MNFSAHLQLCEGLFLKKRKSLSWTLVPGLDYTNPLWAPSSLSLHPLRGKRLSLIVPTYIGNLVWLYSKKEYFVNELISEDYSCWTSCTLSELVICNMYLISITLFINQKLSFQLELIVCATQKWIVNSFWSRIKIHFFGIIHYLEVWNISNYSLFFDWSAERI